MSRAVVLGGGGPVGIGWEAGLLVGLAGAGVDVGVADRVIGTSAGSVVGFQLASGADLSSAVELVGASADGSGQDLDATAGAEALEGLMAALADAAGDPDAAEDVRARLGHMAVEAVTLPEAQWLEMFAIFAGAPWPERFACTAVECASGTFQVWDHRTGVDPQLAVASSCAVPAIFPPVTINGRRYMDGGVRDMLNSDVAAGHDTVLTVSCTLLELPPGLAMPAMDAVLAATRAQIDHLRDGGAKVETVVPGDEMLEISGWGLNLMDFGRAGAAYEAGVRQGAQEAGRLAGFWAG